MLSGMPLRCDAEINQAPECDAEFDRLQGYSDAALGGVCFALAPRGVRLGSDDVPDTLGCIVRNYLVYERNSPLCLQSKWIWLGGR